VKRADAERLRDIRVAAFAITSHITRADVPDDLVFDAIRMRLLEIGEAVKDLDHARLSTEPGIPWRAIAGMRDALAHRYFGTSHAIVFDTARNDIPLLLAAVERLLASA
jgi:uncharacterized protein with HEPN domain